MYGTGTHSFLNSTEHRQMKRERAEVTEKFERGEIPRELFDPKLWLLCTCRSFQFSHSPDAHRSLPHGDLDWRRPEERRTRWEVSAA